MSGIREVLIHLGKIDIKKQHHQIIVLNESLLMSRLRYLANSSCFLSLFLVV